MLAAPVEARPIRVVIADDSPEVRELVRLALSGTEGISVVGEAADGAEALAVVDAIRPDAVLLDVAMPVMDGLDALKEIRSRYGDALTVVVWSGFSAVHVAERALEMGASAYVEKSGNLDAVIAALRGPAPVPNLPAGALPVPVGAGSPPTAPPRPTAPVPAGPLLDEDRPGPAGIDDAGEEPSGMAEAGQLIVRSSPSLLILALAAFAAIFAWRVLDTSATDHITELYVLPVVLVAIRYGTNGGLVAGLVATAGFVGSARGRNADAIGYFSSIASYLVAGVTVGWYSDQTQRMTRLRERDRTALAAANRRLATAAAHTRSVNSALADTNADLRQFMHVASHDLAEPLRTMSGFAQLVSDRYRAELDDQGREFLGHIVGGAARMQSLLDDLRAYTRASQQDLRRDRADLDVVVRGVLAALAAQIRDRGAVVDVPAPLPDVTADAPMLGLVIQNLVSNAIKFNDSEPPAVRITAEQSPGKVTVAIADNGIGIAPEHQDRIFSLFQRLHTRTEYPGTGLGLAICRRVVDRHGGAIRLESVPGQGTTFFVELPAGGPE